MPWGFARDRQLQLLGALGAPALGTHLGLVSGALSPEQRSSLPSDTPSQRLSDNESIEPAAAGGRAPRRGLGAVPERYTGETPPASPPRVFPALPVREATGPRGPGPAFRSGEPGLGALPPSASHAHAGVCPARDGMGRGGLWARERWSPAGFCSPRSHRCRQPPPITVGPAGSLRSAAPSRGRRSQRSRPPAGRVRPGPPHRPGGQDPAPGSLPARGSGSGPAPPRPAGAAAGSGAGEARAAPGRAGGGSGTPALPGELPGPWRVGAGLLRRGGCELAAPPGCTGTGR